MTRREGAILTAYTGIFLCWDFSDFGEYAKELLGRSVYTHEFGNEEIMKKLKEKSEPDFVKVMESQNEDKKIQNLNVPRDCKICTHIGEEEVYLNNIGNFSTDNTIHFTKDQADAVTILLNKISNKIMFYTEREKGY